MVATYVGKHSRRGLLKVDDPMRAADVFIALVLGEYQMKMLCGEEVKLTPDEVDRHLDYALDTFLKIYGPENLELAAQDANACGACA